MTLQHIRRAYEKPVLDAAAALTPALPVFVDNQPFTEADGAEEHIRMRLDFGESAEETICDMLENIRGTIVVEIYTHKNRGPGRGQTIATAMARALMGINSTRYQGPNDVRASVHPITGPNFYALEGRPHYLSRLGCGFQATYTGV